MSTRHNRAFTKFSGLRGFISRSQTLALANCLAGEEGEWFEQTLADLSTLIESMPTTYGQGRLGDAAIVYLHYFTGGCDWWITEKEAGSYDDSPEEFQWQAYGMADIGFGTESGYVCLPEILAAGAELDLHWKPKTLAECRNGREAA